MELIEVRGKDFCCFQEFTQPLQGQGLVWITGENRDTSAADNNGSGKSTLFKALTWGLYGHTIDGERGDKIIRRGQTLARVEVVLADEKGQWIVSRERRKGSPKLQLIQPDGTPFEAAKDVLQDHIIEMVGLDFAAFKNTILYGQNDSSRFAHPHTKDAERKEMLHRILKTGILKQCHEWALERRRELKTGLVDLDAAIERTRLLQEEQDVGGLQVEFDEHELRRADNIERHLEDAKSHKRASEEAQAEAEHAAKPKAAKTAPLKTEKAELVAELEVAETAAQRARELSDEIEAYRRHEISAQSDVALAINAVQTANDHVERLEGEERCPTCNSPLDEGDAKEHMAAMRKQVAKAKKMDKKTTARLREVRKEISALEEERNENRLASSQARTIRSRLSAVSERLAVEESADAAYKAAVDAAEERARVSLERARAAVKRLRAARKQPNPHAARLKTAKSKIKRLKKQRKGLKVDRKESAAELAHVEFWVRGFSNQGLPSYILDAVMPYVGTRANHYLETLADGDITMEFKTQREMKSSKGEYRDEIDIAWRIEGVEDSYPPSGGQLKKMEIATDLALMDLVATREGSSLDILALDEVLDGLDAEGRQRVLMLLGDLRTRRGSVFVISHESEMSEIFEKSVTVIKEDGVSRLAS